MNSKPEVVTWSKHFSQRIQKHYFVHSITKISQWETPSDSLDNDPSKVLSKSFSNQGNIERGSVEILGDSTKSTLAHLSQSHLRSTSNCDGDLLTPIINYDLTEANGSIRIPSRAPNSMLQVRITYRNSPTDSRKIAQSWEDDMMFIDLLNEAQSKVRLAAFGNSVEVQLWNYDHTKEPMLVSMEDGLSATFEICDKIPKVEFLLYKVDCTSIYGHSTPDAASTGENNEIEQLLTNIAPQLFDKNQLTTNINNLWDELQGVDNAIFTNDSSIEDGQAMEQTHQLQIYKEPLQPQIKEEKNIASEHDYFDHKKEEEIEIAKKIAADSSLLPSYLPISGKNSVIKSRRVRFRDDIDEEKMLTENEGGDLVPYADKKLEGEEEGQFQLYKFPRLGDRIEEVNNGENYDETSNEMSINENCDKNLKDMNGSENYDEYSNDMNNSENHDEHLQNMKDTANFDEYSKDMGSSENDGEYLKHLFYTANYARNESRKNNVKFDNYNDGNTNDDNGDDDGESIDTDREEEFEEQEEFSDKGSHIRDIHDNVDDKNNSVTIKYEDINNSVYGKNDFDDVASKPVESKQDVERNDTSTRSLPLKQKILCRNFLGGQLGLKRKDGVLLCCRFSAKAKLCGYTHIQINNTPKDVVLSRIIQMSSSSAKKMLLPAARAYKHYKNYPSKNQVGVNNSKQASRRGLKDKKSSSRSDGQNPTKPPRRDLKDQQSSSPPNDSKQTRASKRELKDQQSFSRPNGQNSTQASKIDLKDQQSSSRPNGQKQNQVKRAQTPLNLCKFCGHKLTGNHNCILRTHPQRNTSTAAWLQSKAHKLWANSHFAEHGGVSHSHLLDGTPWVNPLVSEEPQKNNENKTVRTRRGRGERVGF